MDVRRPCVSRLALSLRLQQLHEDAALTLFFDRYRPLISVTAVKLIRSEIWRDAGPVPSFLSDVSWIITTDEHFVQTTGDAHPGIYSDGEGISAMK